MADNTIDNKILVNTPKPIHLWDVNGYVKISNQARKKFKDLIQKHGVNKLARELNFDKETIYSLYNKGRKRGNHSIKHLLDTAISINYSLNNLEKEVTHYGTNQTQMYATTFPFPISPLILRAVSIHGDGSFYYKNENRSINAEWYQSGNRIKFMERLLDKIIVDNPIKIKSKENNVYSISIPNHLIKIICKSLNLKLEKFNSVEFFKKVSKLPIKYKIQVFFQFIVDEGHFKGTTMTVSQKKTWSREGFKILIDSLDFDHSNPANNRDDITIYNFNFPRILTYLNYAKKEYGDTAGLWFKEKEFIDICKKIHPLHYPLIRRSMKANREIFKKLKIEKNIFSYEDLRKLNRTSSQINKAIRTWKKNGLIIRIGWNKYKIL